MKDFLLFAFIFCLFLAGSELAYQDELQAPTAADYDRMKCDYWENLPECRAQKEPKVANN